MNSSTRAMRARTASREEKAALWPTIVAAYKGYDGYQRNTDRDIPGRDLRASTIRLSIRRRTVPRTALGAEM